MGETKRINLGGIEYTVTEVTVTDREKEPPLTYELEDGAVIRVANPVTVVYRLDGTSDAEGNPGYVVKTGTSVTVVKGPRKSARN